MTTVKVVVASHDAGMLAGMRHMLERNPSVTIAAECTTPAELAAVAETVSPDVLLLDDELAPPAKSADGEGPVVIYVSATGAHALRAFDAGALDYLVHPIQEARLHAAIERAASIAAGRRNAETLHALQQQVLRARRRQLAHPVVAGRAERVQLDLGTRILFVHGCELIYVQSKRDATRVHTTTGVHELATSFEAFVDRLDPDVFLGIDDGLVVNVDWILDMDEARRGNGVLRLRNGTSLLVKQGAGDRIPLPQAGQQRHHSESRHPL